MIKSISPIFERCPVRSLINSFPETQSLGPTQPLFRRSIRAKSTPIKELLRHSKASRASNSSTKIYIYIHPLRWSGISATPASSLMLFREPPIFFPPPRFENQFPNLGINSSPVNVYIYIWREWVKGNQRTLLVTKPPPPSTRRLLPPYRFRSYEHTNKKGRSPYRGLG